MTRIFFMPETPASKWMMRKFLDWQSKSETKKTVKEFAEYLGVARVDVTRYLSGDRSPDNDNLQKIGAVLGWDIFDLLGKPRPDPLLTAMIENWGVFTGDDKDEFTARLDAAKRRGTTEALDPRVGKSQPKRKA